MPEDGILQLQKRWEFDKERTMADVQYVSQTVTMMLYCRGCLCLCLCWEPPLGDDGGKV
jgi:hypothetical protein